jgi:hypothetical protein
MHSWNLTVVIVWSGMDCRHVPLEGRPFVLRVRALGRTACLALWAVGRGCWDGSREGSWSIYRWVWGSRLQALGARWWVLLYWNLRARVRMMRNRSGPCFALWWYWKFNIKMEIVLKIQLKTLKLNISRVCNQIRTKFAAQESQKRVLRNGADPDPFRASRNLG